MPNLNKNIKMFSEKFKGKLIHVILKIPTLRVHTWKEMKIPKQILPFKINKQTLTYMQI